MRTAAVVGGGIAGLAVARGLIREGWRVTLFEQAPTFGEVGAGISLWANALRALDALDLGDEVRRAGTHPGRGGFRDAHGRWIMRSAGGPDELVMVHRADLLRILLDAVPPDILRPGARVDGVHLADGKAVVGGEPFDLLVGADGLRSAVRAAFWPDAPGPRYTGHTAWRTIVHSDIDFDGSETWGDRQVFGAFPMTGGRVYCYAAAALPVNTQFAHGETAEFRRRFADWPDPIPALVAEAREVLRHDLHHLPPLPSYVHGPVALVGDAAHAMSPNLGQGACQALEDAVTLARVSTDLAGYDALRRPRSQRIARQSRVAGTLAHHPAGVLRNAVLRVVPDALSRRSLRPLLDWRPPA